ncbi:reverse transcriptase [Caerostris extrusa]|uniref:Reverse transcriptase n=1 Tax=Caerostris extrusa TaxID=172846 RepID=A0AAV4VYF9_CAEEX|nr:reverse transcriptase [Caerostris extrusa]
MGINAFWPRNPFSSSNADNSSLPVPCIIHVVSIVTHLQAHHMSQLSLLLAATLNHHLNQTTKELKEIAEKLQESLYVENCVASVDSEEELKYFCNESQKLLQSAKFDLRGWKHTKFKETVLNQEENEDEVEVPLLGLSWNTVDDTLSCDFRKFKLEDEPITKRKILSLAHKILIQWDSLVL